MAYKVIILYRLYMPSYFLGTFTEYPYIFSENIENYCIKDADVFPLITCCFFFYSLFALYVWIVFICFSKHLFDGM